MNKEEIKLLAQVSLIFDHLSSSGRTIIDWVALSHLYLTQSILACTKGVSKGGFWTLLFAGVVITSSSMRGTICYQYLKPPLGPQPLLNNIKQHITTQLNINFLSALSSLLPTVKNTFSLHLLRNIHVDITPLLLKRPHSLPGLWI